MIALNRSKVGVNRIGFFAFSELQMCAGTFCNAVVSHRKIEQFPKQGHKGILTGGAKPELSQKQVRLRGNDVTHALSSTAGPAGFDLLNNVGLLDERFRLGVLLCLSVSGRTTESESGCPLRGRFVLLISEISELPLRQSPISRWSEHLVSLPPLLIQA
jgi:hypothetical protein